VFKEFSIKRCVSAMNVCIILFIHLLLLLIHYHYLLREAVDIITNDKQSLTDVLLVKPKDISAKDWIEITSSVPSNLKIPESLETLHMVRLFPKYYHNSDFREAFKIVDKNLHPETLLEWISLRPKETSLSYWIESTKSVKFEIATSKI
jgi:hypothetical protein